MQDIITMTRHYGFKFLSQTYQVVNPFITETDESVVQGYSDILIDHDNDTITINSAHSIQEIYDYIYYNLTENDYLTEPEYFTTTDGVTFNTSYSIINNASITGSGTLITTGTYTGSGSTTLAIQDSTGVFNNIQINGLIAGSRVRINNGTDNIELYKAVVV